MRVMQGMEAYFNSKVGENKTFWQTSYTDLFYKRTEKVESMKANDVIERMLNKCNS